MEYYLQYCVDTSKLSKKEASIWKNLSITTPRLLLLVYGDYYKYVLVQRDQLQVTQISYITKKIHWLMDVSYTGDQQNNGNTGQTDE
jgi:hypothetical protein